jgi:hypothetical protein
MVRKSLHKEQPRAQEDLHRGLKNTDLHFRRAIPVAPLNKPIQSFCSAKTRFTYNVPYASVLSYAPSILLSVILIAHISFTFSRFMFSTIRAPLIRMPAESFASC